MGFGIFIHHSDSIYDDSPAEQYQFPSQYLRRVEACVGDWIIYYEPREVADTRGYFAIAKGDALLTMQCKLSNWWSTMSARTAYRATKPRLPT